MDAGYDQILELAIVDDDGNVIVNQQFRPTRITTWPDAERIHGISPDDIKKCPIFLSWRDRIQKVISEAKSIVGYDIYYDLRMMYGEGINIGTHTRIIDVMDDFREIYKEWSDHLQKYKRQKLTTCANFYHFDWNNINAHGALADVLATRHCYHKMKEQGVYI